MKKTDGMIDLFRWLGRFRTRLVWLFTGDCGHVCEVTEPYGFVPECGCPVHDFGDISRFQNKPTYPYRVNEN